jgi:Ca2+-binding EF-hand superfamily protein
LFVVNPRETLELEKKFYKHLETSSEITMDKAGFKALLASNIVFEENVFDVIFRVFDEDNDGVLTLEEFVSGISNICHASKEAAGSCMIFFL